VKGIRAEGVVMIIPALAQVTELELALCSRNEEIDRLKRDIKERDEDLLRDEQIFATKMKEIRRLQGHIEKYKMALQQLEEEESAEGEGKGDDNDDGGDDDEEEEDEGKRVESEGGHQQEEEVQEAVAEAVIARDEAEEKRGALIREAENRSKEYDDYRRRTEKRVNDLEMGIKLKEELISTLANSEREASALVRKYQERVRSLEDETVRLQENLAGIQRELEDVSHMSQALLEEKQRQEGQYKASLRVAQTELQSLRQQQDEQDRIARLKQRSDDRIAMLEREVERMARERDSLVRKLKEEEKVQRLKAEGLARHVQALKQQVTEYTRKIQELEVRNSNLHKKAQELAQARKRTSGGGGSGIASRPRSSNSHNGPSSSRIPLRSPRSPLNDEEEEEGMAPSEVLAWFNSRWQSLADSVKITRQLSHHRQRQEELVVEHARQQQLRKELLGVGKKGVVVEEEEQQRRLEEVDEQIENVEEELRYQQAEISRLQQLEDSPSRKERRGRKSSNQEGEGGGGGRDSEQRLDSFLAELVKLPSKSTRALLQETCRLLLDQHDRSDHEATELSIVQMRLDQKTAVCADYAKALQRTKVEFGRRLSRSQKENEDKVQYLLKQLREYERMAPPLLSPNGGGSPRPFSAGSSSDNGGSSSSSGAMLSPTWMRKQLAEEQKKRQELEALNLSLYKEIQSLHKLFNATTTRSSSAPAGSKDGQRSLDAHGRSSSGNGSSGIGSKPGLVRLPSKALREVPKPPQLNITKPKWAYTLRENEAGETSMHTTTTTNGGARRE